MSVISVLQRRCSSSAVRDFINQSKRNSGDELQIQLYYIIQYNNFVFIIYRIASRNSS